VEISDQATKDHSDLPAYVRWKLAHLERYKQAKGSAQLHAHFTRIQTLITLINLMPSDRRIALIGRAAFTFEDYFGKPFNPEDFAHVNRRRASPSPSSTSTPPPKGGLQP
jgi:hypothetical protein